MSDYTEGLLELHVEQFSYTTAQIEENRFSGETPNPLYFVMPRPVEKVAPVTLRIVDGEARVVRDQAPPDAQMPNPNSVLFDWPG